MSFSLEAIYNSAHWAIASHSKALASLQEKAATGQDINRASDDPYNANRILDLLTEGRNLNRYVDTVSEVINILDFSSSVVQQMTGEHGIGGALTALTSALTPIYSDETVRSQKADELDNILEEMVSLANKERMGQYLFGGADSTNPPYVVERNQAGEITRVTYQGSYEERNVEISPGVEMSAVLVGDHLFRADDGEAPVFYGDTGAAAGTGTHSVRGDVTLTVGGSAGAWVLSTDGGATTVTVTGAETNVPVVNSETGEVLFVDTTGITKTGTEAIRVPGTYDVFNILIHARDTLRNDQELSSATWNEYMNATIESLREVDSKLVRAYPIIGGRLDTLDSLKKGLEDIKVSTEDEVSWRQDADITEVAVDLARHQVLYEMSLSVSAKMFSLSLVDFIR